jgi:hypothetical protein
MFDSPAGDGLVPQLHKWTLFTTAGPLRAACSAQHILLDIA